MRKNSDVGRYFGRRGCLGKCCSHHSKIKLKTVGENREIRRRQNWVRTPLGIGCGAIQEEAGPADKKHRRNV